MLNAKPALAFPFRQLSIRLVGGKDEGDITAIARTAKLAFLICHFVPLEREW